MKDLTYAYPVDRSEMYPMVVKQLESLTEDETLVIPNLANAAALLTAAMEHINWVGFYLTQFDTLILGPYQGHPACIRIPYGKGVCGTAAQEDRVQYVKNVADFPGHIACDSASKSEIVVPIHSDGMVVGVLDIDSPVRNNFGQTDIDGLTEFVRVLEKSCDWKNFRIR